MQRELSVLPGVVKSSLLEREIRDEQCQMCRLRRDLQSLSGRSNRFLGTPQPDEGAGADVPEVEHARILAQQPLVERERFFILSGAEQTKGTADLAERLCFCFRIGQRTVCGRGRSEVSERR